MRWYKNYFLGGVRKCFRTDRNFSLFLGDSDPDKKKHKGCPEISKRCSRDGGELFNIFDEDQLPTRIPDSDDEKDDFGFT